jgi:hypothetical protein
MPATGVGVLADTIPDFLTDAECPLDLSRFADVKLGCGIVFITS